MSMSSLADTAARNARARAGKPPAPDPSLVSYDDPPRRSCDPDRFIVRCASIGFFVVATAFLLGLALVLVLWFGKQLGVW